MKVKKKKKKNLNNFFFINILNKLIIKYYKLLIH